MPRKAWVYIGFVYTAGLLITIFTGLKTDFTVSSQWSILLALVIFDTFAQIIKAEAPDHQLYHTNLVFHFAGVIMLEPFYYVLLVTIPHLIEWGRERTLNSIHLRDWYLQPFNICVHIIVGISAYFVYTAVTDQLTTLEMLATPLAVVVASIVYVFLNHVLVGLAIFFARGVPIRESGILELGNLSADLIMLLMGYTVAVFWKVNPWLIWVAMTPLFLVYKALTIPNLERQAQIDPKTGVWNTSYFNKSLQEELTRAQGLNRPMTIVMADLDLLRNINNTYGHLAGDVVLQGVASILRDSAEPYDVVARFGGEEFAILMPETTAEQAFLRVEAMRLAIQEANFVVATHEKPLKATMSFGIAGRMNSEQSAAQLVHCADIAVYQAKQNGRNQTYVYHYKRDSNLKIPTAVNELAADSSVNGTENGVVTAVSSPTQLPGSASRPPQAPDTHKPAPAQSRHKKTTLKLTTNRYIGLAVAFVIILALPLNYHWETIDGIGLAAFVILILIVEILSIDIYVKETTVSTAAAPYLAGVLLFGPAAAIILAPVIAIVVFIKQKSTLDRLIFNSSNHMMSGLLCAWLLSITGTSILEMPVYWQIIISVVTAGLIYLSTTWLLAGVISLNGETPVGAIWNERFKWLAPYYMALGVVSYAFVFSYHVAGLFGVFVVLIPLLMLRFSQKQYVDHTETMVTQLRKTNSELRHQSEEINLLNEELLLTLARSIDLRDPFVMEHSKNVARYAVLIATEMGLSAEQIEQIRKAGLLHDIGKLGIPETILFKPAGLSDEEYRLIKEHVNIGADLIYGCHSLRMLIPFVKYHHERYDGRGYPIGLSGEKIPLEARILNVADAVEAMASDRPYKKAMSPESIVAEVKQCAGMQFDPDVAEAFCRVVASKGQSVIINSARDVVARGVYQTSMSGKWP